MKFKIPTMLTIDECAKETKMSRGYIRDLATNKKIVHIKSGSKYLINLEKFVDYLNNSFGDEQNNSNLIKIERVILCLNNSITKIDNGKFLIDIEKFVRFLNQTNEETQCGKMTNKYNITPIK